MIVVFAKNSKNNILKCGENFCREWKCRILNMSCSIKCKILCFLDGTTRSSFHYGYGRLPSIIRVTNYIIFLGGIWLSQAKCPMLSPLKDQRDITCPRATITEKEQKEACGCVVQNLVVGLDYELSASRSGRPVKCMRKRIGSSTLSASALGLVFGQPFLFLIM
jgi:hypothetical protein